MVETAEREEVIGIVTIQTEGVVSLLAEMGDYYRKHRELLEALNGSRLQVALDRDTWSGRRHIVKSNIQLDVERRTQYHLEHHLGKKWEASLFEWIRPHLFWTLVLEGNSESEVF